MANRYISHPERLRANGLLDMLYYPAELEWETGIEMARIEGALARLGMPHIFDEQGRMQIRGVEFTAWVKVFDKQKRFKLGPDEAYCVKCNRPVPMNSPIRMKNKVTTYLQAQCPNCGTFVNRAIKSRGD